LKNKNNKMSNGLQRFETYLQALEVLLTKAATQKNAALYLYQNNARTSLFMLEGLAKVHAGIHNQKKFTKIKERFKVLEDALGAIDYYDGIAKQLSKNKKIPVAITNYLQAQVVEKTQYLNELLITEKWLQAIPNRIAKITKKLLQANWLQPKAEIKAIESFYGKAIYDIVAFTKSTNYHFDNMEADVHEIRRKLRWLSIYPQAMQGSVQLVADKKNEKILASYLTKEITTSVYNKMPDAGNNTCFLLLEKNYFLANSWMIAELGKLKDNGLLILALKEAIQQTNDVTDAAAYKKIYTMLGPKQPKLEKLLTTAAAICKQYFAQNNIEHLVVGISVS
jgi:hypothetical protein